MLITINKIIEVAKVCQCRRSRISRRDSLRDDRLPLSFRRETSTRSDSCHQCGGNLIGVTSSPWGFRRSMKGVTAVPNMDRR